VESDVEKKKQQSNDFATLLMTTLQTKFHSANSEDIEELDDEDVTWMEEQH
jgi:hypothetical protein